MSSDKTTNINATTNKTNQKEPTMKNPKNPEIDNNLIAAFTKAVKDGKVDIEAMMEMLKGVSTPVETKKKVSAVTGASPVNKAALDLLQPVEVEELEKLVQEEEVEVERVFQLTEGEEEKIKNIEKREENRAKNWVNGHIFKVYSLSNGSATKGIPPQITTRVNQGVQMVGILEHLWRSNMLDVSPNADKDMPAVMHIHSDIYDEVGIKLDITTTGIQWDVACRKEPKFLMVKGKHLINAEVMQTLCWTFAKAADVRAYASGTAAPGEYLPGVNIYFGDDKTVQCEVDENFELKEVFDENGNLVEIDMGADGNMIVHSQHWIPKKLGISKRGAAFQVRFWEPKLGIFVKGIVVVDDTAIIDDRPAIICNSSMIKGRYKNKYNELRGKTIKIPGVTLRVWNRPHHKDTSRGSFEWLQMLVRNGMTEEGVRDLIQRFWWNFEVNGGIDAYIRLAGRQDENLAKRIAMLREVGVDPMSDPDVAGVVRKHLGRDMYTLSQGAGIKSPTYTIVMDAGVPAYVEKCGEMLPGIAIDAQVHYEIEKIVVSSETTLKELRKKLSGRKTEYKSGADVARMIRKLNKIPKGIKISEWLKGLKNPTAIFVKKIYDVYLPGDIVLIPRYPLVAQQNFCRAVVVKPKTGVLKATGRLADRTYRAHPEIVTKYLMGDADGDRGVVEGRPFLTKWMSPEENRVENVHGGSEVTYGLEPDKLDAEKDRTQRILMIDKERSTKDRVVFNEEAINLICRDGGGPVGQLTYVHAMLMHLAALKPKGSWARHKMLCCALAVGILVQESIDAKKRSTPFTCPWFASNPDNWINDGTGHYSLPTGTHKRYADTGFWYKDGTISAGKIRNWALTQAVKHFPELKLIARSNKKGTWWSFAPDHGVRDVLAWRAIAPEKKIDPCDWPVAASIVPGENLVMFCSRVARESAVQNLNIDRFKMENPFQLIERLQQGILNEYDWEPLAKNKYNVLFGKSGISNYAQAMRESMGFEWEERNQIRLDAEREVMGKLSKLSVQEVVSLIASQSHDPSDIDKTMRNVLRLISLPGSPIIEVFGIEPNVECNYLDGVRDTKWEERRKGPPVKRDVLLSEKVVQFAISQCNKRQAKGEAVSRVQICLEYLGIISSEFSYKKAADQHLEQTGTEIHKCRDCQEKLLLALRRYERKDDSLEAQRKKLYKMVSKINTRLREEHQSFIKPHEE